MGRTDDPHAVDDYLGALPESPRAALQRLRELVHRAGVLGSRRHLSLHVMSTTSSAIPS